jgi:Zn-dependent protease
MMPRQGFTPGKIFGIPIHLDYSWFLILILLVWLLAGSYYPAAFPDWPAAQYWVLGAVTAVFFFGSVLLHELGHSLVAVSRGIPVRSITLFVFGGVAQIAEEPTKPSTDFLIAASGLAVSFLLAVLFLLLQPLASPFPPLLALFRYLAYINGALLLFNLIPGFPLDGGRVFRAVVWGAVRNYERATAVAATLGRIVAFLFILLGVWMIVFGSFLNGIWILFIGWFLENAASSELQQSMMRSLLTGQKVSQIMGRDYVAIPADITLQRLVDDHILGAGRRFFVVEKGGLPAGIMTLHNFRKVPRTEWPATTAAQTMIPAEKMDWVAPDADLWAAVQKMDADGVNQLPVMEGGRILGVLTRENFIQFLQTLREMR